MSAVARGFFKPRRLAHVNFYVADLERTMSFYTRVLGIEETYRTPLGGGGFVSNGNTHHDIGFTDALGPLGMPRGAKPGTLSHIAFELENEVELVKSYENATRAGAKFLRAADHDIAHSVYGMATDTVVYELYADVVKDWRRQRSGIVTKPKPNWAPGTTPPVAESCYHENPEIRRVDNAIFHPLRTTHAAIVVSDLDNALEHYCGIIGLERAYGPADTAYAVLNGSTGEQSLVLVAASASRRAGFHHVALRAASAAELGESVKNARQAGVKIELDLAHGGRRCVFVRDPDGCLTRLYADDDRFSPGDVDVDMALYVL